MDFTQKKNFSDERINDHISVTPVGTKSIVIFFMARTVPPSFVDNRLKLRVLREAVKNVLADFVH